MSLLELLIDRLHFLILSCSKSADQTFCSIGKAAESLIVKSRLSNQRPLSAGYVGGDNSESDTTFSPNYEEDVRRHMFPFVQSLVISLNSICKKYVVTSTAHETWSRENKHLDKMSFVKITGRFTNLAIFFQFALFVMSHEFISQWIMFQKILNNNL